jgi:exopolysaccharide biosynthesis protein
MIAALVLAMPAVASAATSIAGYRTLRAEKIAPGVVHEVYQRFTPNEAVHVARIGKDAPYVLRSVPSHDYIHGERETTSSICRRTKCLVGINGDFWSGQSGLIGALVQQGELLRSPTGAHFQFVVGPDGEPTAGPITWHGRFITSDNKSASFNGVNVPRKKDGIVLYSRRFARSTKTDHTGAELVVSMLNGSPRLGHPASVRIEKFFPEQGNTKINDGRLVLSGTGKGAEALRLLWHRAKNGVVERRMMIRLRTTPDAFESIGGTPLLIHDGKPAYDNASTAFVQAQHPRTIVGWTKDGQTLLVTVDGRQLGHSAGMTIPEAARMMLKLGAVDAINLDGGGSTTFVVRGKVLNKPSDRLVSVGGKAREVKIAAGRSVIASNVERPVASALVVVKRPVEPAKVAVKVSPGRGSRTHAAATELTGDLGAIADARSTTPERGRMSRGPLLIAAIVLVLSAGVATRRLRRRGVTASS